MLIKDKRANKNKNLTIALYISIILVKTLHYFHAIQIVGGIILKKNICISQTSRVADCWCSGLQEWKKKNGIYKTNHKQVDAAGIKREDKAGGAR